MVKLRPKLSVIVGSSASPETKSLQIALFIERYIMRLAKGGTVYHQIAGNKQSGASACPCVIEACQTGYGV